MITPEVVRAIDPRGFEKKFVVAGIRSDGRTATESRPIIVVPNVISNTVGSASCRIGNTSVIAGITAGVFVQPEGIVARCPDGKITVAFDLSLVQAERRLAQQLGGALAHRIELVLNNESVFAKNQLLIRQGSENMSDDSASSKDKAVWDLQITIVVVCDDGSLFDCAFAATMAALKHTSLPALDKQHRILTSEPQQALKLGAVAMAVSFAVASPEIYLVDPSRAEEQVFPHICLVAAGEEIYAIHGPEVPAFFKETSNIDLMAVQTVVWPQFQKIAAQRVPLLV